MIRLLQNIFDPAARSRSLAFDLRLQERGFPWVIENLARVESELLVDIVDILISQIEQLGATFRGDSFQLGGRLVRLLTTYDQTLRAFFVVAQTRGQDATDTLEEQYAIDSFGAIKTIIARSDKRFLAGLDPILREMQRHVRDCYRSLEVFICRNIASLRDSLFNDLYMTLNREIERQHRRKLIGKSFFNVTIRDGFRFQYFFDVEALAGLSKVFTTHQVEVFSPAQLFISVIGQSAADTINSLVEPELEHYVSLNSSDFVSQDQDLQFWLAEATLVDFKELSCFTLFKSSRLLLQINCQSELAASFAPIFKACAASIRLRFQENIHDYVKVAKRLSRLPRVRLASGVADQLAKVLGKFAGSTMATFVKQLASS